MSTAINNIIRAVEDYYDADIYVIPSGIDDNVANLVSFWTHNSEIKKHKNFILMLRTYGGYPDSAYKIARTFQMAYNCPNSSLNDTEKKDCGKFYLFVNGPCKSAGTLIATAADVYLLTDGAEFGPIDAQIRKPDEAGERTSGLVTMEAFDPLRIQALRTFCSIFSHLRQDGDFGLSSKMAAEIANNLTVGLMAPVYAQIDPLRVAELDRILRIGAGYAERLSHGNLRDGAIGILLAGYPSHGFVIDFDEAKRILFKEVEEPLDALKILGEIFCSVDEKGEGRCLYLKEVLPEKTEADHVGKADEASCPNPGNGEIEAPKNSE